mgnify:CR=1 FL=1
MCEGVEEDMAAPQTLCGMQGIEWLQDIVEEEGRDETPPWSMDDDAAERLRGGFFDDDDDDETNDVPSPPSPPPDPALALPQLPAEPSMGFPGKAQRKLQPLIKIRLEEKSAQGRKGAQPLSSLKQVKQMLDGKAANHQLTQLMVQDYRPYSFKELQTFWQNIPFNNLRQAGDQRGLSTSFSMTYPNNICIVG